MGFLEQCYPYATHFNELLTSVVADEKLARGFSPGQTPLRELLQQPFVVYEPGKLDELALGLINTPAQTYDPFITQEVRNWFYDTNYKYYWTVDRSGLMSETQAWTLIFSTSPDYGAALGATCATRNLEKSLELTLLIRRLPNICSKIPRSPSEGI